MALIGTGGWAGWPREQKHLLGAESQGRAGVRVAAGAAPLSESRRPHNPCTVCLARGWEQGDQQEGYLAQGPSQRLFGRIAGLTAAWRE